MNSSANGAYGTVLQCWDREALRVVYGGPPTCTGAPSITAQPQSQTVPAGGGAYLSVAATNGCAFFYQWYKDGNPIPGATTFEYNASSINSQTTFRVAVSNSCGTTQSQNAVITVQTCNGVLINSQPAGGTIAPGQTLTLSVGIDPSATTPVTYQWYKNNVAIPGATGSSYGATQAGDYFVRVTNQCNTVDSAIANVKVSATCVPPTVATQPASSTVTNSNPVTLTVVAAGSAPFTYQWFRGASGDASNPVSGATSASFTTPAINATSTFWVKVTNSCGFVNSATATITFNPPCGAPAKFSIYGPGTNISGVPYKITWDANAAVSNFELQESLNSTFTPATTSTTSSTSVNFTHTATTPTRYYYRARAFAKCNNSASVYSNTIEVVITPAPSGTDPAPNIVVPEGSNTPVTFTYLLMPPPNAKQALDNSYTTSTDKPWITVTPASGTIPPNGTNLSITVNPSTLSQGSNTGTVNVTSSTGTPIASVPTTVTVSTPVTLAPKSPVAKNANSLVVPVVGHAQGSNNSLFLSDVRLVNTSNAAMKYLLTYTPSGVNGLSTGKQATLDVKPNETKALNDIARSFFGLGGAGDSAVGVLDIRSATTTPLDPKTTIASSRTYNVTSNGTYGQFIPAIPSSSFIGQGGKISLQQVAQSAQYRTNVGFVEGAGEPVTASVKVFNLSGAKVGETTVSLQPFEHRQVNNFLQPLVGTLVDGRIEIQVTSATGRMSAYASVVDNNTNDPLLVSPVVLGGTGSSSYVIPGIADITNANNNWRSDVRIFNAGASAVTVTLRYYPQGGATPSTKSSTIAANSILALDGILANFFGITNSGGALQITTPNTSSIVATARTYDSKSDSTGKKLTYGQFIPAITPAEAVGLGDRKLQVLQVEESTKQSATGPTGFRSNLGLVEVSGNPVTIRVTAYVPDAVSVPFRDYTLAGNEFRQITQVLKNDLKVDSAYNARIEVQVIGGTGRIAAYASVVDNKTQDPTYVPAQ
jgi:hypothetical protein